MSAGDEEELDGAIWRHSVFGDTRLVCCSLATGSAAVLTSQPLLTDDLHTALLCRRVVSPVLETSSEWFTLLSPHHLVFSVLLAMHQALTVILVEGDGNGWVLGANGGSDGWAVQVRFSLMASGCQGQIEHVSLAEESLTFAWVWRGEGSSSTRILSRRLLMGGGQDQCSLSPTTSIAKVEGWCRLALCGTTLWLLHEEGLLASDLISRSRVEFCFKNIVEPLRFSALQMRYLFPVSGEELLCRGGSHLMLFQRLKKQTLKVNKVWRIEFEARDMQIIGGLLVILDHEALAAYSLQSIQRCDRITLDKSIYTRYVPISNRRRTLWMGRGDDDDDGTISVGIASREVLEIVWTMSLTEEGYRLSGLSTADTGYAAHDTLLAEIRFTPFHTITPSGPDRSSRTDELSWLSWFDEALNLRTNPPISSCHVLLCQHWRAAGCKMDALGMLDISKSQDLETVFRFHFVRGNVDIVLTMRYLSDLLTLFPSSSRLRGASLAVYERCLAVSLTCPENIQSRPLQDIVLMLLLLCKDFVTVQRLLVQWGRNSSLDRLSSASLKQRRNEPEVSCFVNF